MGTRGVYGFRVSGKDKVSYNHSDSCPSGLGVEILGQAITLGEHEGWDKIKKQAKAIRMVGRHDKPTAEDIEKFGHKMNLGVGNQSPNDWYCLLRETQGDLIANLELGVMIDSADFILDSLFCEWGYIINLDSMKLEVYRGFQSKPHTNGRYAEMKSGRDDPEDKYYPCALVAEFDLDNLPASPEEFVKALPKDE